MRALTRWSICVGTAAAMLSGASVAAAQSAHHWRWHQRQSNGRYVYVDDNTATTNTIAGFVRHGDGSLSALPGSPFAAGGAGNGSGNTSQGSIVSAYGGRYVLAVDNGSNQVSVLQVNRDGSLTQVGSPVSSGGTDPVSVGVSGDLVYVANAPSSPGTANVTGFRLSSSGVLTPIPNSTVTLPNGAQPDDVVINSTGTNLVVPDVALSVIYSYSISHHGLLTAASSSPVPAEGPGPFGSDFSPVHPSQLFVSNAHGGTANGTVSAYNVSADGTLNPIGSSPFADFQTAPCWIALTPNGRYLFAVNAGTPSVSSYSIASNGNLTLVGSFPFKEGASLHPLDDAVAGNDLYVKGASAVAAFAILPGGFLHELNSSPSALPAGSSPSGITAAG